MSTVRVIRFRKSRTFGKRGNSKPSKSYAYSCARPYKTYKYCSISRQARPMRKKMISQTLKTKLFYKARKKKQVRLTISALPTS